MRERMLALFCAKSAIEFSLDLRITLIVQALKENLLSSSAGALNGALLCVEVFLFDVHFI